MNKVEQETAWVVLRDGVVRTTEKTYWDAFAWLLRQVPYSVDHATKYEGWSIEERNV